MDEFVFKDLDIPKMAATAKFFIFESFGGLVISNTDMLNLLAAVAIYDITN